MLRPDFPNARRNCRETVASLVARALTVLAVGAIAGCPTSLHAGNWTLEHIAGAPPVNDVAPAWVPVYGSADGKTFTATAGIPATHSVQHLVTVSGEVVAVTQDAASRENDWYIYEWNAQRQAWQNTGR